LSFSKDVWWHGFESIKVRALLAYLAVEAKWPHRRKALAGLLWPDLPDETARTNLASWTAKDLRVSCH
jgi:DNA-binding SARP family transcriptional activator